MKSNRTVTRGSVYYPLIALFLLAVAACSYMAPYSEHAYQQATVLKVESLELMAKATEPYPNHATEAMKLLSDIEKAYEYARGLPKNQFTTQQWEILKDPKRHLVGGYLARWQKEGKLSTGFIEEARGLVADAFDTIIGLESGKIKKGDLK